MPGLLAMNLSILPRNEGRPARRRSSWISSAVPAAALVSFLGFLLVGCGGGERPFDVTGARSVTHRAARLLHHHEPSKENHLRSLIELAEGVTAREQAEPFWRRTPASVELAWARALDASAVALKELRTERRDLAQQWAKISVEAAEAVKRADLEARAPGLSRIEIAAAQESEIHLGLARKLAGGGVYETAIQRANLAIARAKDVNRAWNALHSRFDESSLRRRWRSMVEETIAESARTGGSAFVVDKLARRLDVYADGKKVLSFRVELGSKGLRQKMHSGDKATPEGRYRVVQVRSHGQTRYYKALLLNYPNAEDLARFAEGKRRGQVPKSVGPGNLIEIHGDGGRGKDWTDGCIALTNKEMDSLFRYASVNTPVTIVGTIP